MEDLRVKGILSRVEQDCTRVFGSNLVGVYVHGSVAFGCFCWENSDIDLLVVTKEEPGLSEKEALLCALLQLDAQCPEKGLEFSVVLEKYCRDFVYPTPFELHFSNVHKAGLLAGEGDGAEVRSAPYLQAAGGEHRICADAVREYCRGMRGTDKDLAAHFTVLRSAGVVLCGKEIAEVFGEVPREAYLDSIWEDVAGAGDEIAENPVYVVLNLCRVLAFLQEGLVCSKAQGGEWALENLPGNFSGRRVVERAAECYRTGEKFFAGNRLVAGRTNCRPPAEQLSAETEIAETEISTDELRAFAEAMLAQICRARECGKQVVCRDA